MRNIIPSANRTYDISLKYLFSNACCENRKYPSAPRIEVHMPAPRIVKRMKSLTDIAAKPAGIEIR